MGGELNCTPSDVVEANADIAGNGILAAFLLSALLILGAIMFGYFSEALPEEYLNEIDQALIDRFRLKHRMDLLTSKIAEIKNKTRAFLGREKIDKRRKLSRKERQEALTRFVLALSDQQLVTGFAVLVGAIANQRTLTTYDFRVTVGLAWFSATTHLATLDFLRHYFMTHETVRKWRVCGMVVVLILLLYCYLVTTIGYQNDTVPFQCLFQDLGSGNFMGDAESSVMLDPFSFIPMILTIIILLTGYGTRIQWSQGNKESKDISFLDVQFFRVRAYLLQMPQLSRISAPERTLLLRELRAANRSRQKRQRLDRARNDIAQFVLATVDFAMERFRGSFLSLAPPLMFMLSFGFANLVFTRWMNHTPVIVDGGMGFGQITPICFLALPILAAAEIYYEAKTVETNDCSPITEASLPPTIISLQCLDRSNTIPITIPANDLDFEYLSQRGRDYDNLITSIKIFFHTEVNMIQREWSSANTAAELVPILQMKDTLLKAYNNLRECEDSLPVGSVICAVFIASALIAIATGFLLNVVNDAGTAVAATILVMMYYFSSLSAFYFYSLRLAYAMKKESILQIYEEIKRDPTLQNDLASHSLPGFPVPATNISTSRSSQPVQSANPDDVPMRILRQRTLEMTPSSRS